jgi:hypothetical protein
MTALAIAVVVCNVGHNLSTTALYRLVHCVRRLCSVRRGHEYSSLCSDYCESCCGCVHCGRTLSSHPSDSVVPLFTPQHGRGVMTYASDRSSDVVERYDGEWFEGKMQVRYCTLG